MKKVFALLMILATVSVACKNSARSAKAPAPKDNYSETNYTGDLFFKMERTPCFGRCPVYEVSITPSGEVTFIGKHFVEMQGTYKAQVSEFFLDQIADYARKINYFEMEEKYDSEVTDLPATTTTLWLNGQMHSVYNRMGAPQELIAFEKYVEEMIFEIEGWEIVEMTEQRQ